MKELVLAAFVAASATFGATPAVAEDAGDSDSSQPTMADLAAKMDDLSSSLAALSATVANLASQGQEMAVFMTGPKATAALGVPDLYLVGESTIPGFPPGPTSSTGAIAQLRGWRWNAAVQLPAGTYLFELRQPYSDNVLCHGNVSRGGYTNDAELGLLRDGRCPRIFAFLFKSRTAAAARLYDGFGIYTSDGTGSFSVTHRFPGGTRYPFTAEKPRRSYVGSVKITKLK